MLFNLDFSLLEVLFIYTIKKGKKDIFNMFAHIPSLQLVTNLLDSNKGGSQRVRTGQGAMGWFVGTSGKRLLPQLFVEAFG